MWSLTCVPINVYNALYKFKPVFRCVQARHFSVFCWVLIALILDNGKGKLKDLCGYLPPKLRYWTLMRMVRSGQWDASVLVDEMSRDVLGWLPAPADGVIHLSADKTRKDKCGRKHPLGLVTRESKHSPYHVGFEMVLLIASWDRYRIPLRLAVMNPKVKGHQNMLFRHMLETVDLPSWVRRVIVSGDAGFAANPTLKLIEKKGWTYVFAMARNRKFTNGKYVSDLMRYLPKSSYRRRAIHKPDGRRCDYWVFQKRTTLHNLGDVTMVLSKKRRNSGPNQVRLFVTNLQDVKASTVLSLYAWRWGVEVTIKELKGGLHLGQMQVASEDQPSRVTPIGLLGQWHCRFVPTSCWSVSMDEMGNRGNHGACFDLSSVSRLISCARRSIELSENGSANSSDMRLLHDSSIIHPSLLRYIRSRRVPVSKVAYG